MRYLCPPKLKAKYLLGFWTVPEIMVMAVFLALGVLFFRFLLIITISVFVFAARPDGEHSLMGTILLRCKYYIEHKTYRM